MTKLGDFVAWLEQVAETEMRTEGVHDLAHLRRVHQQAQRFAEKDRVTLDPWVLAAAAYLHDIVNLPKNSPERRSASRQSAARARDLLGEGSLTGAQLDAVAHAIEAHSFSAGIQPHSLEAKYLQDADRMEALGAIGLARLFHTAGQMGSALFDADDLTATARELDDKRFAVDHVAVKLAKLPATMQTAAGKAEADARMAVIDGFVRQLAEELNVSST